MAAVYDGCYALLRPGGFMVTVTKNTRRHGRLFDLAATTAQLASFSGFLYQQHVVSLLCKVSGGELVGRPSFFHRHQTRRCRSSGDPLHLVSHEDVQVFQKGDARV